MLYILCFIACLAIPVLFLIVCQIVAFRHRHGLH